MKIQKLHVGWLARLIWLAMVSLILVGCHPPGH